MAKTSMGLEQNTAGLLCYVLWWASGIYFIKKEKDNRFVRFHAWQSVIVFGAITVVLIIIFILRSTKVHLTAPVISIFLTSINLVILLGAFILWFVLIANAYQERRFKLPWAGNYAEKKAGYPVAPPA
jgi:uncharacterized membrane protein